MYEYINDKKINNGKAKSMQTGRSLFATSMCKLESGSVFCVSWRVGQFMCWEGWRLIGSGRGRGGRNCVVPRLELLHRRAVGQNTGGMDVLTSSVLFFFFKFVFLFIIFPIRWRPLNATVWGWMIDTPFPPLPVGIIQVLEGRIKMESLRDKKLAIEIQRLVVGIKRHGHETHIDLGEASVQQL